MNFSIAGLHLVSRATMFSGTSRLKFLSSVLPPGLEDFCVTVHLSIGYYPFLPFPGHIIDIYLYQQAMPDVLGWASARVI